MISGEIISEHPQTSVFMVTVDIHLSLWYALFVPSLNCSLVASNLIVYFPLDCMNHLGQQSSNVVADGSLIRSRGHFDDVLGDLI